MGDSKTEIEWLNRKNYATSKVQCRMALVKDRLWGIVVVTEGTPAENMAAIRKYAARKDRALVIIVLAVEPSLLYLLGEPEDPKEVWTKLQDQFQKRTWWNKYQLQKKLYSMKLKEDGLKRECRKLARDLKTNEQSKTEKGYPASTDADGMLVAAINQVLSAKAGHDSWIVDSGATCHMSNNENLFVEQAHVAHGKD